MTDSITMRDLLAGIGIGQFNATGVIPYMQISPATTDPKASQIIILVEHVQRMLFDLGATNVVLSGRLDEETARALDQVVGPNWERMSWATTVQGVLNAKHSGFRMHLAPAAVEPYQPVAVGGPLDFLPDVPGGLVTYGVAAYLLYRHFKRRA
jgi:hypothetical protein